ncbi:hypothetical protein HLB44_02315 [Aquincola sp. S2]|uniref:Uncharacterized protein n=1 Tax=Pseudaquabacterium terrae TaxID=2732868 RepID=A0ABX2EAG4_9BURK|nr:hypothetical protein [Aquabacterium terrae]NRF65813.1 hypothetical protein [Aquabacterium terrae]
MPRPGPTGPDLRKKDTPLPLRADKRQPGSSGGGGAKGGGDPTPDPKPKPSGPSDTPPKKKPKYGVTALTMPPRFAPSIEKVGTYTIDDAEVAASSCKLELFHTVKGVMDESKPLWTRSLSKAEYKHGDHKLEWDGKISGHNGGSDYPGDWLSPHFSPYKLRITLPGGSPETQEATFKIEVAEIALELKDAADKKLFMNDIERRFETIATVKLKKIDGSAVLTKVPVRVDFSFTDPPADNTTKADSFKYADPKCLGKKADADALHWAALGATTSTSVDSYKLTSIVLTDVADGADLGKAKVGFKPSGVGGDDFKLKAEVKDSGGTVLLSKEGDTHTVWRFVDFANIHEMVGLTHVSTNGSTGTISPVFDPAFVRYTAGAATGIAADKSVKYIGLWESTGTPQTSWATMQAKTAAETPSATEIADANYAGADAALVAKRDVARAAIKAKAQAWATRIDSAFHAAMPKWVSDAAIPANALVAIQYYHPKYSSAGGDHATNEWKLGGASTPAWLTVDVFPKSGGGHYYTGKDPDALWINWGGLSHGSGRVTVPLGNSAATVKQVVRHEAGHATKSFFKRDVFGPSLDHSASNAGIMYYTTSGGTTFTDREKKILRGINP